MSDVTNNHFTALGMPDGTEIGASETKSYDNWADNAKNGVVAYWVKCGVLTVDGEDAAEDSSDKDELIAQLAELGVKADRRSSVEKLQEKLDEAMAE